MTIYLIVNLINGKAYVGQTSQPLKRRWGQHKCSANKKINLPLYNAMNKYGIENFSVFTLAHNDSREILNQEEQFYIKTCGTIAPKGYNLKMGGTGGGLCSEETKKKIGQSKRGKKLSLEHKIKLSISHMGNKHNKGKISKKRISVIGTHIITGETIALPYMGADSRFRSGEISKCCSGKKYFHSHGGYFWMYK